MAERGKGNDPLLESIVDEIRECIWWPLFHKQQWATGQLLLAAFAGQRYIEFFTTVPGNQDLSNLNSQGQVPFEFYADGLSLKIAANDIYDDAANAKVISIKELVTEHGRIEFAVRNNNTVCNHPADMFPPGTGLASAIATTQNATSYMPQSEGVPHKGNYWRFGGSDPTLGIRLRRTDAIVGRLHLDAVAIAALGIMFPDEQPPAKLSDLGAQFEMRLHGWAYREMV